MIKIDIDNMDAINRTLQSKDAEIVRLREALTWSETQWADGKREIARLKAEAEANAAARDEALSRLVEWRTKAKTMEQERDALRAELERTKMVAAKSAAAGIDACMALEEENAAMRTRLERYQNPRCQREECARERALVDALEAKLERLKEVQRLSAEHEKITLREIGALPSETVMGAATRLHAEVAQLRAELERLKPSGQVAEDVEHVREALLTRPGPVAIPDATDDALSRLASQAQAAQVLAEALEPASKVRALVESDGMTIRWGRDTSEIERRALAALSLVRKP